MNIPPAPPLRPARKKRILAVSWGVLLLLIVAAIAIHLRRPIPEWRIRVDQAAGRLDPVAMGLTYYKDSNITSDNPPPHDIQTGLIRLGDGEQVKFWFISHHSIQRGKSYTRFDFPDGTRRYFTGLFCCEVEFGGITSFPSRRELLAFLDKYENVAP